jgi:hypothetical protein
MIIKRFFYIPIYANLIFLIFSKKFTQCKDINKFCKFKMKAKVQISKIRKQFIHQSENN